MTLERPDLPASCASLHADRLLRWRVGARVFVSWGCLRIPDPDFGPGASLSTWLMRFATCRPPSLGRSAGAHRISRAELFGVVWRI